jgi:hypothetical protein
LQFHKMSAGPRASGSVILPDCRSAGRWQGVDFRRPGRNGRLRCTGTCQTANSESGA